MDRRGFLGSSGRKRWALPAAVAVVVLVVTAASSGHAAPVSFKPSTHVPAGSAPLAVAAADLNGDGTPDLAVANARANAVSVLLGTGAGAFGPAAALPTGGNPHGVAAADVNADGNLDLAVTNYSASTVSVLLGHGDGTFAGHTEYPTGAGRTDPYFLAAADLNGDGRPDLVVANSVPGGVGVLLGNGDGTFGPPTTFGAGNSSLDVAVADLNGDGKPDLAVANQGSGNVSVLLGHGDGTFAAATHFPAGAGPRSVAVADVNGDAKPDLAVALYSNGDAASVLLGQGDGTFGPAAPFGTGRFSTGVALADLNRDGKPDLALSNQNSADASVLPGNGDGTFGAPANFATGNNPFSLTAADLNGDAQSDLAVANLGSDTVSIMLSNAAPVAAPDPYPASEDTVLAPPAPAVLGNDSDADDTVLTAVLASPPGHGDLTLNPDGSFSYTPLADYHGADSFTYRAQDAAGAQSEPATVTLTVAAVNDAPVATDDAAATPVGTAVEVAVTGNDTDADGDALTAATPGPAAAGTASCSGSSCTYTPRAGFTGSDSFTYTLSDGQATDEAVVHLTVTPADVPAAAADTATTAEDTAAAVAVTANDVLGEPPTTLTLASPPGHGTATCDQAGCSYAPAADYHGADSFTYTLTDADGDASTAGVAVTVTPVNDPPALTPPPEASLVPGDGLPALSATDPDGDRLTFVVAAGALPDGVSLNTDGTFAGTARAPGTTTARIRVCDAGGACDEGDLRVGVRVADTAGPGGVDGVDVLPRTGPPLPLAATGLGLLLAGGLLLAAPRRRTGPRRTTEHRRR